MTGADRRLDRDQLAELGREWLLHGHLMDRVSMGLVLEWADRDTMLQVAIEEWMAASPVYSLRMRDAMNFDGEAVDAICKNLQLDIGAPHQFMDFRYRLHEDGHAEFWLAHCGALMDVEPLGEDYVAGMCHTIEDPTFDATAAAASPHAQVRPIHRPPRRPADRVPHCHWRIDVRPGEPPAQPHPYQAVVERSQLARLPVRRPDADDDGGWPDYSGPFDPEFTLEQLSRGALLVVLDEVAIQSQLLLRGLLLAIRERFGAAAVRSVVPRLVAGWCGLTAERLRTAFDLPADADGLARMLELHPMFAPASYLDVRVERRGEHTVRLGFGDCPAAREGDELTWFGHLGADLLAGFDGVGRGFDRRTRCTLAPPAGDELHAVEFVLDPAAPSRDEPGELQLARFSKGAAFRFRPGTRQLEAAR